MSAVPDFSPARPGNSVTPAPLTHELLAWIEARPRTYAELVEAWTSNCPRHPAWDDAVSDGLVEVRGGVVALTARGRELLAREVA
jgi:hypothetical protein